MNATILDVLVEATHESLTQRLDEATRLRPSDGRIREDRARVNAFMAATSRHLAAVDAALVPEAVRRLPDGRQRANDYLHQARLLEQSLARLKARVYGEQHAAHLPWTEVWDGVRRQLAAHNEKELELTGALSATLDRESCENLADRVYRAELKAPTRAHPYLPHTGFLGLTARKVWAVADRFWDTAEGRVIPPPVRPRPKDHSHDSLLTQYLVGEPLMDADAPVVHHRPRRRRIARARVRGGR
jgi:hypothetical protein